MLKVHKPGHHIKLPDASCPLIAEDLLYYRIGLPNICSQLASMCTLVITPRLGRHCTFFKIGWIWHLLQTITKEFHSSS
jgi:hypothetical protein